MAKSSRKHLSPSARKRKGPKTRLNDPVIVDKPVKQRRVNERAQIRKDYL